METAFADVTNILKASVNANYVSDTTRSIDNKAIINVIITPANPDEEKNVLEKRGRGEELFVSELNDKLAAYNVTLLSLSEMVRVHAYLGEFTVCCQIFSRTIKMS